MRQGSTNSWASQTAVMSIPKAVLLPLESRNLDHKDSGQKVDNGRP